MTRVELCNPGPTIAVCGCCDTGSAPRSMTDSTDAGASAAEEGQQRARISRRQRLSLVRFAQLFVALGGVALALIVGSTAPFTSWVFWVATASAFSAVLV